MTGQQTVAKEHLTSLKPIKPAKPGSDPNFSSTLWLPEKDQPVLLAAMPLACDVLVTGDSTHFGADYGKRFEGVIFYSPRQLAELI